LDKLAVFETDRAERYLEMICLHFGRKVQSDFSSNTGWVQFPFGRCDMTAGRSRLQLRACAENQSQLDEVVKVITSHLERFAFRENPTLDWQVLTT